MVYFTVGLKLQTSYTVRFEITATPQYELLFTEIPHPKRKKKSQHRNTGNHHKSFRMKSR